MNTFDWKKAANDDKQLPTRPRIEILLIDREGKNCTRKKFLDLFAPDEECADHLKQLLMAPISIIEKLGQGFIDVLSVCYFEPAIAIHSVFPKAVVAGVTEELARDVISYNPLLKSVDLAVMFEADHDNYGYLSVDEFSHNICFAISQFVLLNTTPPGPNAIANKKKNMFNFYAQISHRNFVFLKDLETCLYHDTKLTPISYYKRFFPEIYPPSNDAKTQKLMLISNSAHFLATLMFPVDSYKNKYEFFFPRSITLAKKYLGEFSKRYFDNNKVEFVMGNELVKEITKTSAKNCTHLKLI